MITDESGAKWIYLEKITKKSMTKSCYAICRRGKSNVSYTGTSDKTDWRKEAYKGIVNGVGDCFTGYRSAATRAGIDNMRPGSRQNQH